MDLNNQITLTGLDISLFVLTIILSVVIGIYFANKNENMEDYMLGGRNQKLVPVAVSMMASFVSGLTLIGCPAELYYHGLFYATIIITHICWVPLSAYILLPVFYKLGNVSVNQYLELRYHVSVRRIISVVFMVQMTLYNAVVLYVPSLSLKSVLGIPETISIGAVGLSCVIYSTFGGIKAVIWTDFFQAGLMLFSLICICIGGTLEVGGFSKLIETNRAGQRLSFEGFSTFDLTTRHTIYTMVFGAVIMNLFVNGANQIQVQRALTLPTLKSARQAQLLSAICTSIMVIVTTYIGLILYANYNQCDPFENRELDKRDAILIYYIATHLENWPGLRGIFVAGIFAATLSTLSSFQNSMSALFMDDILEPIFGSKLKSDKKFSLYLGKMIALLFGLICIGFTFIVGRVSGLLQVALTLFGALGAPLLVAFFLGMLTRFVNTTGILIGAIGGYIFGLYVEIYQTFYAPPLLPTKPVSTSGCQSNTYNTSVTSSLETLSVSPDTNQTTFDITSMSYLWLPVFEVVITGALATICSLLTGGWRQHVNERYLVSWRKQSRNSYGFERDQMVKVSSC